MKKMIGDSLEAVKTSYKKVTNTVDKGLETVEKVVLIVGGVFLAGVAIGVVNGFVNGELGKLIGN